MNSSTVSTDLLTIYKEEQCEAFGGLYIHVPFCAQRCKYCDFSTQAASSKDSRLVSYTEEITQQINYLSHTNILKNLRSLYIGGGTPSFLGKENLIAILKACQNASGDFSLGSKNYDLHEWTVEANPESVTEELFAALACQGVNRISLGVQSFNPKFLTTLGRIHDRDQALYAIDLAHRYFENFSIDLMCGLPGQTFEDWQEDLDCFLSLDIPHVSIYPLMIEQGTAIERLIDKGVLADIDDDTQADMMEYAARVLKQQGYHRYEVASYAREDFESRHNTSYWTGIPYLGLGPGAVSMRQNSQGRIRFECDFSNTCSSIESLSSEEVCAEDLMMGMRRSQGISVEQMNKAYYYFPELDQVLENLMQKGLLYKEQGFYKPTTQGWLCGNELYGSFFELTDK